MDKAGRLVIPRQLREQLGFRPGEVELSCDGAALRIEPVASDDLVEEGGRLVISSGARGIDDDLVRALQDAGRR